MTAATIGLFLFLLGLCVGSFLNVVIYRLPHGLSISKPTWSFCPVCRATLRWYENLPVVAWLALRARCRHCGQPISAQYPLVEAVTGLAFVLTYYLLFVEPARFGVGQPGWPTDTPLLLAWLVLVAALIACSAMDLVLYVVDTRVTDVALLAGIVLYAFWPRPEFFVERASGPAGAAVVVAFAVSALMLWLTARRQVSPTDEQGEDQADAAGEAPNATPASTATCIATTLAIVVFVGLAVWLLVAATELTAGAGAGSRWVVPAALLALFVAMVLAGGQPRAADDELRDTIAAEAPTARRVVLRELLWLTPTIVTGIGTYFALRYVPTIADAWQRAAGWSTIGAFTPLGGAVFAIHGAIVAAAAGWIIRIIFTLAFGREAFGLGDIYILAAAGAVVGWDLALLGFFCAVFIALAGWGLGLLLKRHAMIPFGPPLALGFLVALWLNRRAAAFAQSYWDDLSLAWKTRPDLVLIALGMLLVVAPLAVMLARLLRRLIEPQSE
jgi:prepilin signal peptidase PulO-like enzyme (type II secretory pathway)